MNDNELFQFADEENVSSYAEDKKPWIVLSVEDDPGYQQSLLIGLKSLIVTSRPIRCITASSATEAAAIIADRADIAVILLDVVMEHDDAGLFLVNTVRNILGNSEVRIILLTGQPGMAPRLDTMRDFDIDEYWNKVDLTQDKLRTVVASNIRTWHSLTQLTNARRGLQMIVDASRAITSRHDVNSFTHTVLFEISRLIGVPDSGGLVCAYLSGKQQLEEGKLIAATGRFSRPSQRSVKALLNSFPEEKEEITLLFQKAVASGEHQFDGTWSALYFSTEDINEHHYLFLVKSPCPLKPNDVSLLTVFSENIDHGFTNIALMDKLSSVAYKDSDLNIANRNWLKREFQNSANFDRQNTALVLVKVADFSTCEILLGEGYAIGMLNEALTQLRQRLSPCFAIARLEEDTFAFLIHHSQLPVYSELEELTSLSITLEGITHKSECFIAVLNMADIDNNEPERAVKLAEATLRAGHAAGVTVRYYSPSLRTDLAARYLLLKELHCALKDNAGLIVRYQPKHDMLTGKIVGAEALVRWQHPLRGELSPGIFMPVAETSGLINKIDILVMQQVVKDIQSLTMDNLSIPISFNVSIKDFDTPLFMDSFQALINKGDIDPALLEIEITETQAIENYENMAEILKVICASKVRISIDDFGTGYSSLAHISKLSAHTFKVDKTFIDQLTGDKPNTGLAVIRMMKKLGEELSIGLVAEGVETEAQKAILVDAGYEVAQGFLFSKPMPLSELIMLLKHQRHH
ncbi:EAL domain-containing protein [Salinimonas chungwhensis]|uniref:EAL domain-containing protein n=1 Tax=Salinimonas chungwhensis TaxID=265425 RepID=UPI0003819FA9|nr:EAL domain-containing protein [Salinimonas chungwhensis]